MRTKGWSSLFQMYFLRIVCIILLPILTLGIVFVIFFTKQIQLDVEKDMRNTVISFQSTADRVLDVANSEAMQMAMQMAKSKLFTQSMNFEQEINELASLRTIMETACGMNDVIEVLGFHQAKGKVLCQYGYYDLMEYRDIDTVRAIERTGWRAHMLAENMDAGALLAFYYTVPLYQQSLDDYVYVKVSNKAITDLLSGIEEHASFVITDENGQVLLCAGDALHDSYQPSRVLAGTDALAYTDGYYSMTMFSSAYPFRYTILRSDEFVHSSAAYLYLSIGMVFLAMVLLALICARLLAKRFSLPITSLVFQLQEHLNHAKSSNAPALEMDEITYLYNALDKLFKNEDALIRMVSDHKQMAVQSMIRHVLEGDRIDAEELESLGEDSGFRTSGEYFVFAVEPMKSPRIAEAFNGVSVFQLNGMMRNCIQEAMEADFVCALLMPGGKLCGVIGGNCLMADRIDPALNQLRNQLSNVLSKAPLAIGYGRVVSSLAELDGSYAEARHALTHCRDMCCGVSAYVREDKSDQNNNARICTQLISLMEENGEQAHALIDELYGNCLRGMDTGEVREFCLWLLARCAIRMEEKALGACHDGALYQRIRQIQSGEAARDMLHAQLEIWISEMEEKRNQHMTALIVETVKYIEENYASDISLTELADRLDVSPQYLSACFRREMSITFIDYLSRLRLQKARTMILETNLPVNRIAELNGYNSPQYFIRRFKEAYGVSPAKYKS